MAIVNYLPATQTGVTGIQACWQFIDTASSLDDLTANNNDLVKTAGDDTSYFTDSDGLKNLDFGTGKRYEVASPSGIIIVGDLTIEWVGNKTSDNSAILGAWGPDESVEANSPYYVYEGADNDFYFWWERGLGANNQQKISDESINGKHYFAITRKDESGTIKLRFYIDGVLTSGPHTITSPEISEPNTSVFYLGSDGGGEDYLGYISSIRISNAALSDSQILDTYNYLNQPGSVVGDPIDGRHTRRTLFAVIDGDSEIYFQRDSERPPPTSTTGRAHYQCLRPPAEYAMGLDIGSMLCSLDAMTFKFDDFKDSDGKSHFGKLFSEVRWEQYAHARTVESTYPHGQIDANATSIETVDASGLPASGTVYLQKETITYTGKTDNTLTGVQKGIYPIAGTYYGDTYILKHKDGAGYSPAIGQVPFAWLGRRIALYCNTYSRQDRAWGKIENATLLWAGRISKKIVYNQSEKCWQIECTSLTDDFDFAIGENLPETELYGINLYGTASKFRVKLNYIYDAGESVAFKYCDVSLSGFYINANVITYYILETLNNWNNWKTSTGATVANTYELGNQWGFKFIDSDDNKLTLSAEFGGATVSIPDYITVEAIDGFNHALCALGFEQNFELATGAVEEYSSGGYLYRSCEYTTKGDVYAYTYHPTRTFRNGNRLYFLNNTQRRQITLKQGDNSSSNGVLYCGKAISDEHDESFEYLTRFVYTLTANQYVSLYANYEDTEDTYGADSARIEQRAGKEPVKIYNVLCPTYRKADGTIVGPYQMLLQILCSTGTVGYNGTYDVYPRQFGLGIQDDLVDAQSFLDADAEVMANELAHRKLYYIKPGTKFKELLSEEAKLWGKTIAWNRGKLKVVDVLKPDYDSWSVTIDGNDINSTGPDFMPCSVDTIVNRYQIDCPDILGQYENKTVITDMDSAYSTEIRAISIKNPWFPRKTKKLIAETLAEMLLSRNIRHSMPLIEVELPPMMVNNAWPGDVIYFTSRDLPNPDGSGDYGFSCYGLVINRKWNYRTWIGRIEILLLTRYVGIGYPFAPSALLDRSRVDGGWESAESLLHVNSHVYSNASHPEDGAAFNAGDYVYVVERSPADRLAPLIWGPCQILFPYATNGSGTLAVNVGATFTSFDADREYVVTFSNFGVVTENQKSRGSWLAASSTEYLTGSVRPHRFG